MSKKQIAFISLILGLILLGLKFFAYKITGSQSIFSDALESIVNVIAGVTLLVVLRISAMPADKDHPYGHGKIEYFSSIFEGGAISFAGVLIIIEGIQALFKGAFLEELNLGVGLILLAGILNGVIGYWMREKGRKLQSMAMVSNGEHLISDFITSLGIIIALILVKLTGLVWIDSALAIIIGGILIRSGVKILQESGGHLMDAEDPELTKSLVELFEKKYEPGMIEIHDLKIMRSGNYHHIDVHLTVPKFWSVKKAHDFGDKLEHLLMQDYPHQGELHLHVDPCIKRFCSRCELVECEKRESDFIARVPFTVQEATSIDDTK